MITVDKKVKDLKPALYNPRKITEKQLSDLKRSIDQFGFVEPVIINKNKDRKNIVISGHQRLKVAKDIGLKTVPCVELDLDIEKEKELNIRMNKAGGEFDFDLLDEFFTQDQLIDFGFEDTDFMETIEDLYPDGVKGSMNEDFGVSPFSVLDGKNGNWQDRKKYWTNKGISSSDGREIDNTSASKSINRGADVGGSIFDPVLCEIAYQWFCPENGTILDPFSGGSVRGLMASFLEKNYVGIDIRQEQINANNKQLSILDNDKKPVWICGDSLNIENLVKKDFKYDLLFTCPPYADLETYSNNPDDISNMDYKSFIKTYSKIIQNCYNLLNDNSFAVWVVGEVRNKKGNYYNFLGDTIKAFLNAGFNYYNEAVYLTPIGSLPLRAGKTIKASRKMGKAHQNFLVFVKGDGKKQLKDVVK